MWKNLELHKSKHVSFIMWNKEKYKVTCNVKNKTLGPELAKDRASVNPTPRIPSKTTVLYGPKKPTAFSRLFAKNCSALLLQNITLSSVGSVMIYSSDQYI